jgi:hypothetical protein
MAIRLAPVVVLLCLSAGVAQTQKKPAGKEMELQYNDGKKVRVSLLEENIEVMTTEGKATIPVRDIHWIGLGVHEPAGAGAKIQAAVKALGSESFKEREQATADLISYGRCVLPSLADVKNDLESMRRAQHIRKKIEDALSPDIRALKSTDKIRTGRATIEGRITTTSFKVHREYFGDMAIPLYALGTLSSPAMLAHRSMRYTDFHVTAMLLDETVEMKDFLAPDPGIRFKDFLELLYEKFAARGKELAILVDIEAFKEDNPDNDADKIYNEPIKFQPFPKKMKASGVLRLALDRLPKAAYVIRNGVIVVTTAKRASSAELLKTGVVANFLEESLESCVHHLSEISGATIVIDPRLGEKSWTPVTASFRNSVPLETAVRLLAECAGLHVELRDHVMFITDKPKTAEK